MVKLKDLKCISENIDIASYQEFTASVKKDMTEPNWLGDFTEEAIEKILANGGKIWIYYDKNNPVCSMMLIPAHQDNLERFGLTHLNYQTAVDYGPMMVNKDYRGNRLQYQMLEVISQYSLDKGYEYAICTVHPDNITSKKTLKTLAL